MQPHRRCWSRLADVTLSKVQQRMITDIVTWPGKDDTGGGRLGDVPRRGAGHDVSPSRNNQKKSPAGARALSARGASPRHESAFLGRAIMWFTTPSGVLTTRVRTLSLTMRGTTVALGMRLALSQYMYCFAALTTSWARSSVVE